VPDEEEDGITPIRTGVSTVVPHSVSPVQTQDKFRSLFERFDNEKKF
jgi:hypothetical protein